jgi:hypothetical protein
VGVVGFFLGVIVGCCGVFVERGGGGGVVGEAGGGGVVSWGVGMSWGWVLRL